VFREVLFELGPNMTSKNAIIYSKASSSQRIVDAAKKATKSSSSARRFLKSAGIMTPKGNLSPKYR
jgi:hypothetical protein